jgi:hypothetical protein
MEKSSSAGVKRLQMCADVVMTSERPTILVGRDRTGNENPLIKVAPRAVNLRSDAARAQSVPLIDQK